MQRMAFVHKPEDPQDPSGGRQLSLCCVTACGAISESMT